MKNVPGGRHGKAQQSHVVFWFFFVWRHVCHIVIRTDDIIHKRVMCEQQQGRVLIWRLLSLFWIKETIRQTGLLLHSGGGFGSFFFFFFNSEKVRQVINTLSDGNLRLGQLCPPASGGLAWGNKRLSFGRCIASDASLMLFFCGM